MKCDTYSISPAHYNDIPEDILEGEKSVLEFGCATGINQLISKHREFFIENNKKGLYLGIDIETYEERYFNIQQGDIRRFQTDKRFDVVIALHVLEHIELEHWDEVIERLTAFVEPDGCLIIGTPHDEPPNTSEYHLVAQIKPDLFRKYLPTADIQRIRTKYQFAEDGARFAFALLRYIKRWLTRHPYVRRYGRLLVIWKPLRRGKQNEI